MKTGWSPIKVGIVGLVAVMVAGLTTLALLWFTRSPGVFATSVLLSGDTLVTQVMTDLSEEQPRQGRSRVFRFDGRAWVQDKTVPAIGLTSDLASPNGLLHVVALDGKTAVVAEELDGARRLHVVVDRGATWELEQTISEADITGWLGPSAGRFHFNGSHTEAGNGLKLSGDFLVLGGRIDQPASELAGAAVIVLRRDGQTWQLNHQIIWSDWRVGASFFLQLNFFDFSGDTLALISSEYDPVTEEETDPVIAVWRFRGQIWDLEQEISAADLFPASDPPAILPFWAWKEIALDGDTLAVSARVYPPDAQPVSILSPDFSKSQDANAILMLERSDAGWQLQDRIVSDSTKDINLNDGYFGSLHLALSTNTLVVWVPADQVEDPDIIERTYVFVRRPGGWELSREISAANPLEAVRPASWLAVNTFARFMALDGDRLAIVYRQADSRSFNTAYLLRSDGSTWQLEQTVRSN